MSELRNIHQLISWEPPQVLPLIEGGILDEESGMILYGEAKSWKTMTNYYTMYSLANGTPWFGFKTTKCAVLRIQGELPERQERKRIMKFARGIRYQEGNDNTSLAYPSNMYFHSEMYLHLDTSYGLTILENDVKKVKSRHPDLPLVVMIDPIYMMMSGKIRDEYDVKKFLDNINIIRQKYSATFILTHHTRLSHKDVMGNIMEDGAESMMGSSYFNDWCDIAPELRLLNPRTGADRVRISFYLTRNAEKQLPRLEVKWSRFNLLPSIESSHTDEDEDYQNPEDIS
jgi:RecA-family ATPase